MSTGLSTKAVEGGAETLWEAIAPPGTARPELVGSESVEVAIVGGGVAGLSLALHLADRGVHAAVLEAHEPGAGATGRSGGLVVPYLSRHTPASLQARFGRERAQALLQLVAEAANYTFELIGADVERSGSLQTGFLAPVRGAEAAARLQASIADWRTLRGDIEFLDEKATQLASGCVGYQGALFDPSGGALNPLAYARFLAEKAEQHGAALFCNSAATDVSRHADGWRLRTARGSLDARVAVLCANGGNTALHAALARTVLPMSVTQVATGPLSDELRRQVLPRRQALTDLEPDVFSIRYESSRRLITAYPVPVRARRNHWLDSRVNARLSARLPAWQPLPLEYAWQGVAWLNADLLPRLVSVAPDLYAVQACNGRGLAFNTVLGRHLADWLAGGRRGELALELRPPQPIGRYFLARHVPGLLMKAAVAAQRFRGSLRRPTGRPHRGT